MVTRFAFIAAFVLLTVFSFAQGAAITRDYKSGDTYRYRLTCEELHNDKWESTLISVCELSVVKNDSGIYYDEVRWVSKQKLTAKDTVDETPKAVLVKPYRISLHPQGTLDLPEIEVPEMTEPIQDFSTFFVAVSPGLTNTLNNKNDSINIQELVKGNFANGSFIVKGDDCFSVTNKLLDVMKESFAIRTSFLPPPAVCFPYLLEEMKVPVIDNVINNFQMVMAVGGEKYNVQYGREVFFINSAISRKDGKIASATMDNKLDLKIKLNCDKNYQNSQFEIPFTIQRHLTLELLQ